MLSTNSWKLKLASLASFSSHLLKEACLGVRNGSKWNRPAIVVAHRMYGVWEWKAEEPKGGLA